MKNILIIDDDPSICKILSKFLQKSGYAVQTAFSGKQSLSLLKKQQFDLIICDYNLGDINGLELLSIINGSYPEVMVIFISGYGDIQTAVDLVKEGAFHFLTKPLYPDIILKTVEEALSQKKPQKTRPAEKTSPTQKAAAYVEGSSAAIKALYSQVALVAPTDYSVIIHGETGTGKEALAKMLHELSPRKNKSFVPIDCGSLSRELAASELFGHLKGAFTGALAQKKGAFEMADGGTIFLDEIGNLSYEVQIYLLRTLQEKSIRPIGEAKEKQIDVRVVVASNEDLYEKVRQGGFREDLYHRLNEFKLEVPALRSRMEDLPAFVEAFVSHSAAQLDKKIKGLSKEALQLFKRYSWPGNIRELQNVLKRACLLTPDGGYIESDSLPLEITDYLAAVSLPAADHLKSVIQEAERNEILRVLEQVNYNKTKAAAILKIDRKTLYNKLKEIDL